MYKHLDFSWNGVKTFSIIAERGSFSSASKYLRISQPTLSRQIAKLEEDLGVSLFERTGRGLTLTESGSALNLYAIQMKKTASDLSFEASTLSTSSAGIVRISVPELLAVRTLPPLVKKMRAEHPEIKLELKATDEVENILHREADIAIRVSRPTNSELIIRKLTTEYGRFYASNDYIKALRKGALDEHGYCFLGRKLNSTSFRTAAPLYSDFVANKGQVVNISDMLVWEFVKQRAGIGLISQSIGDAEDGVSRVFEHLPAIPFDLWLVVHRELRHTPRLKIVFNAISDYFEKQSDMSKLMNIL